VSSQLVPAAPNLGGVTRIREIREERAKFAPAVFTQAAVAARAGVTVNALRAWELGRARPRKAMARRLARALGVTVEELEIAYGGGPTSSAQTGTLDRAEPELTGPQPKGVRVDDLESRDADHASYHTSGSPQRPDQALGNQEARGG
jgi:transcriptional regulator with XRE-family HTH domain